MWISLFYNHTAIHDNVCGCETAEPLIQEQGVQCCDFFRVAICSSQYILGATLKDIPQKLQASINISQTKLKNIGRLLVIKLVRRREDSVMALAYSIRFSSDSSGLWSNVP